MTAAVRTLFDVTPVWVQLTVLNRARGGTVVTARCGDAEGAFNACEGVRPEDRAALIQAPRGLPLSVQLPRHVAERRGWAFEEVAP